MIKKLHEILLRDVILLDATKSANVLKKYWFVPLWMCRKELEDLATQVFESIGGKTVQSIEDEFDKLYEYNKLQLYQALFKALEIEVGLKSKINGWSIILLGDYRDSPQLEEVLDQIKKHAGIDIQTPDDFKSFIDFIQHKKDKYNEMFPENEQDDKQQVPLTKIIYSVFDYMGQPLNEDMRLINFISMKEMAEERIRADRGNESQNSDIES